MRTIKNRNWTTLAKWAGFLVLCIGLTGETCTDEKGISLVVGANVEALFEARGSTNVYSGTEVVNTIDNADIDQILADNDFEEFEVAFVEAAWFRVVQKDPVAGRTVSGNILVDGLTFISYTSIPVNDDQYAFWTPVPMNDSGRNYINNQLLTYFFELFDEDGIPPSTEPTFTFEIAGDSTPIDEPTSFDWELRLKLTLVGGTTLEIPSI